MFKRRCISVFILILCMLFAGCSSKPALNETTTANSSSIGVSSLSKATEASVSDYTYKNSVSNDTYKNDDIKFKENIVLGKKSEGKPDVGKVAYLTFDDGPSKTNTAAVLDILKKYNIKATFFIVGQLAQEGPELVRRESEEGHFICNHSFSHDYKVLYSSPKNFMAEIKKCDNILSSVLGDKYTSKVVRFPGGYFSKKLDPYAELLGKEGYKYINWDTENNDGTANNIPVEKLVGYLKTQFDQNEEIGHKKKVVILMHDGYRKETTVKALPQIIDYLISKNFSFDTLEKLSNETKSTNILPKFEYAP
ncbi:MAG TPA: polysaccharide deacetylase family protein [Clostridia bacterium]